MMAVCGEFRGMGRETDMVMAVCGESRGMGRETDVVMVVVVFTSSVSEPVSQIACNSLLPPSTAPSCILVAAFHGS